jgi:hypothetical protein
MRASGTIHLPKRDKDQPDRDRLALRFERFKTAAYVSEIRMDPF